MNEQDERLQALLKQLSAEDSDDRRWAVYDLAEFPPEQIADAMVKALQDEHRAVREAASEVLESLPPSLMTKKLTPLLGSDRIEVRNIAAAVLVKYGDEAVEDLIPALFDENEDVRKFGADILGLARNPKAVPALCKAAKEDKVENVAISAVEALGKIGSPEALPTLYELFPKAPYMQTVIIEAIGLIGSPDSAEFLEKHLDKGDPMVDYAIIDALGLIANPSSIPILKSYFPKAPEALQHAVCQSLLSIGRKQHLQVLSAEDRQLWDAIKSCLKDEEETVTEKVQALLSQKLDKATLHMILEDTSTFPPALLVSLARLAGENPGPESLAFLQQQTRHPDDWVAYSALEALNHFTSDEIQSTVLQVLEEEQGLRLIAAMRLAVAKKILKAVPLIEKLLDSAEEDLQHEAKASLEALKNGRGTD